MQSPSSTNSLVQGKNQGIFTKKNENHRIPPENRKFCSQNREIPGNLRLSVRSPLSSDTYREPVPGSGGLAGKDQGILSQTGEAGLAGNRADKGIGPSGRQRTLIHGMTVLRRAEFLLVYTASAPPAIGTQHDRLLIFHDGPPVTILHPSRMTCESRFPITTIGKSYCPDLRSATIAFFCRCSKIKEPTRTIIITDNRPSSNIAR